MAMPTIPAIAEMRSRIIADIESELSQTTPALFKAWNRVIAGAVAGVIILLYQAALWVYRQIFPETADYAALILLGKLVNLSPTIANKAIITADVYGTPGESVPVGTSVFASETGIVYVVTTGGTIAGGLVNCTLTAQTYGDIGNIEDGAELSIVTPNPNLTGVAIVTGTTTEGDDAETEASFRARVISRYKKRLTGGSPGDYELWGLEAPHFIWISPVAGTVPGSVWVYGEVDNQTDGIPTSAQLLTLKDYLTVDPGTGLEYRRPIGADITTLPISRRVFDVEITAVGLSADAKLEIEDALSDYLLSLSPYNSSVSSDRMDAVTDTGAGSAANDVARTNGAIITQLILRDNDTGTTVSSYLLYGGVKAKLGSVTFTDIT